jgi:hypothetical protein
MKELLEQPGFKIEQTAGVFLLPYYGIPGLDGVVRHLTYDDPDVVEVFRDLGVRAGAEYGFDHRHRQETLKHTLWCHEPALIAVIVDGCSLLGQRQPV